MAGNRLTPGTALDGSGTDVIEFASGTRFEVRNYAVYFVNVDREVRIIEDVNSFEFFPRQENDRVIIRVVAAMRETSRDIEYVMSGRRSGSMLTDEDEFVEGPVVARIEAIPGGLSSYYFTLQSAIDMVNELEGERTVTMLRDLTENAVLLEDNEVILDINGYELTGTLQVLQGSIMEITNGTIICPLERPVSTEPYTVLVNHGTIVIREDVNVNATERAISNGNTGRAEIHGASISNSTVNNTVRYALLYNHGTVVIEEDTTIDSRGIINNRPTGRAEINGGSFNSRGGTAAINNAEGTIIMDGEIDIRTVGTSAITSSGTIIMDGEISIISTTGTGMHNLPNGTADIKGVYIRVPGNGILNDGNLTVGGTSHIESLALGFPTVLVRNGSTAEIGGEATIVGTRSNNTIGVHSRWSLKNYRLSDCAFTFTSRYGSRCN